MSLFPFVLLYNLAELNLKKLLRNDIDGGNINGNNTFSEITKIMKSYKNFFNSIKEKLFGFQFIYNLQV